MAYTYAVKALILVSLATEPLLARRVHDGLWDSGVKMDAPPMQASHPSAVQVRLLSDEELHARGNRQLYSLTEAERLVNAKVAAAQDMIENVEKRRASRKEDNEDDHADPDADQDNDQEELFLKSATNVTEEEFKSEQLQALKRSLKPNFQVYMCMQINIDLSAITIPGLHLDLGLLGGISLDFRNGCWSFSLEAALGFDWGFKIYGYGLGLGASMTGSFDLSEVPAQRVLGDSEALEKDASVYAPEGADLRRCHTRNPWMVVQAWIEQKWRSVYKSKKVRAQMAKTLKNESWTKSEKEYMDSYGHLLNGSFEALGAASPYVMSSDSSFEASQLKNQSMELSWYSLLPATSNATNLTDTMTDEEVDGDPDNALPGGSLIELPWDASPAAFVNFTTAVSNASVAPRLSIPAVAMTKALRGFIARLPAYAGQVMERVTDSSDAYTGTDASKTILGVERLAGMRLKKSTGRFWARWPSEERHSSLCRAEEGKNSSGDCSSTPIGVSKRKDGSDQRVLNFAKAMRHSSHAGTPSFWKEMAISSSNLLVRVIGDVKALFAAGFAEDPNWDGSCEALKSYFDVRDDIGHVIGMDISAPIGEKAFKEYPWASRSSRSGFGGQAAFATSKTDTQNRRHVRALRGTPWWYVKGGNGADGMENADWLFEHGMDSAEAASQPQWPRRPTPWAEPARLYPHLWCTLAEKAPPQNWSTPVEDSEGGAAPGASEKLSAYLDRFRKIDHALDVSVAQACENVLFEQHSLEASDVVQWNERHERFVVKRDDLVVGILTRGDETVCKGCLDFDVGQLLADAASASAAASADADGGLEMSWPKEAVEKAAELGYVIGVRGLETRQECERVALPVPFVRMFPRFVYMVEQYVFHMEQVLLEINTCLGETHNTNKLKTAKHAFDNENSDVGTCITEEDKLSMVTERAKYATRLVRKFLIRLGAEDPRRKGYKPGVLPLSGVELQLIHQNNFNFAPMANLMAMDYVVAFGVGVIEEVRIRNDFIRDGDILKYPGRVAGGEPWMFQLEGYFWQYVQELRPELLAIANPLNRISSGGPPERLRPPVEYTEALVFTAQLARNGFCTPNTGLLKVDAVFQRSKQSWSDRISSERCFIGRARPGDFFVQIMRCKGAAGGQEGDFGSYVDWRIRFQGVLLKGDLLTPQFSGVGGNILTSGSMLTAATMSGAAVAAGLTSGAAVEALAPMVLNSSIAGTVLFAGASLAPMIGIGTAAFLTTGGGFKDVCQAFLKQLSDHGVVSSNGWAEPPRLGLSINVALVTWGAVIYRLKSVKMKTSEGRYEDHVKSQKFTSLHFENWNRAELSPVVPFVGSLELYGKVELDWDLTPWVERVINRARFIENRQRQEKCVSCLKAGTAFCDWRKPLESLWDTTYDVCVDHNQTAEQTCERDIGMVDDVGDVVTAEYYSPKLGSASCMEIDFVRANREFRLNDMMRRFFRRH